MRTLVGSPVLLPEGIYFRGQDLTVFLFRMGHRSAEADGGRRLAGWLRQVGAKKKRLNVDGQRLQVWLQAPEYANGEPVFPQGKVALPLPKERF